MRPLAVHLETIQNSRKQGAGKGGGGGRAEGGRGDMEAGISQQQSRTAVSLRPIFTSQIMPLSFTDALLRLSALQ